MRVPCLVISLLLLGAAGFFGSLSLYKDVEENDYLDHIRAGAANFTESKLASDESQAAVLRNETPGVDIVYDNETADATMLTVYFVVPSDVTPSTTHVLLAWETYNDDDVAAQGTLIADDVIEWQIPRRPDYAFTLVTDTWTVYCTKNISVVFGIYLDDGVTFLTRALVLRESAAQLVSHVTIVGRVEDDICI